MKSGAILASQKTTISRRRRDFGWSWERCQQRIMDLNLRRRCRYRRPDEAVDFGKKEVIECMWMLREGIWCGWPKSNSAVPAGRQNLKIICAESPIKTTFPPRLEAHFGKVALPLLMAVSLGLPAQEKVPLHGQQQAQFAAAEIQVDPTNAQAGNDAGRQRLDEDENKHKTI